VTIRGKDADDEIYGGDGELPDKNAIIAFIRDAKGRIDKNDIARAFNIKGQGRTLLRKLLRELTEQGLLQKNDDRSFIPPDGLPERTLIEVTGLDGDGEWRARPLEWTGSGPEPIITVIENKKLRSKVKKGDKITATLKRIDKNSYEARPVPGKIMDRDTNLPQTIVGFLKIHRGAGFITPTDKRNREEFMVPSELMTPDLMDGDLVMAEPIPPTARYPRSKNPVKVLERLGEKDDPRLISLIAIHSFGIPTTFPRDVMSEAAKLSEPDLSGGREDLRHIPLVTIDGADARDFDDAVFCEPDQDPKNPNGWKILVAIADVSFYVRPGTPLDQEAYKRGNSTYFADRVVPMLPERLSNDLCSLKPKVNRACLVADMTIDQDAKLLSYRFRRGLMRSAARLTYEQVQAAQDGTPDDTTAPLLDAVIKPLYKVYAVLKRARQERGALELDLPERKAVIDNTGKITAIVPRKRLDSHQLIEEFMILANVAAAMQLEDKNAPCLYRIHDSPAPDKIDATRDFLKDAGYSLPRADDLHPKAINHILKKSSEAGDAALIHTMLLRLQSQAVYSPDNIGHFGLALEKYAHFTSPIRRYADLVVHRSLVKSLGLGAGALAASEEENIAETGVHISSTERRSMLAERDVMDRFTAQYLQDRVGSLFEGRIASVTRFGLFVQLVETGADGIVPIRSLPRDFYDVDEKRHRLVGRSSGRTFCLADPVIVRLVEADSRRGSTVFEIAEGTDEGDNRPQRKPHRKEFRDRKGPHKHRGSKNRRNHKRK
jgi:ribonuclease R